MTVCFDFNPLKTPWVTPYDRYDTYGNPVPDGKISTYDVRSIPNVLARYRGTPVELDDRRLCDAFYVEMVKRGFQETVLRPLSENPTTIWQDKEGLLEYIRRNQTIALDEITQRQQASAADGRDQKWETDWMGQGFLNAFDSAKNFIICAADKAAQSAYDEAPIMAGAGIVLKREPGRPPRLDAEGTQAHYILQRVVGDYGGERFVGSIDGVSTSSMTDEEFKTAVSGPEDSYVKLGFVDSDWSAESMCDGLCSVEPREIAVASLKRQLSMGSAITECGGIDVLSL